MSSRDSNGNSDSADAQLTPIHVTAVLVASVRAMSNALDALGFPEEDNRIVEQDDGRFGFVTCSHEPDCDDMFALIAELSSSGETWEIQFQADLAPDRMLSHTLSRHRPIVAHEQQVVPHSGDGTGSQDPELPVQDLDTSQGRNGFQRAMRGVKPTDVFAEIGAGPDGRARARIVQRNPRRVVAEAAGADEPSLRAALREAIPKLIFTVSRRVPS
ncbi:MAG: hypothetical protein ABTQ27_17525 [Amaricoccus sp.]|uniref:hypothetical protein n=1 Tax=Amaricoccus sp. TaxID=1872485 RepID=UPI0033150489